MDTFTLEKVLTTVSRSYLLKNQEQKKILSGVYPCDSLLLRKVLQKQDTKSARAIIVNTDESNKPARIGKQYLYLRVSQKRNEEDVIFSIRMVARQPVIIYVNT